MLIGVKYLKKDREMSPREYTYFCGLQDLEIGDLVNAETVNGDMLAMVTSLDVPEEKIAPFRDKVKTITQRATIMYDENGNIEGYSKK